jgi:hypothetical protein
MRWFTRWMGCTVLSLMVAACSDAVCVAVPCRSGGPAFLLTIRSSVTGATVSGVVVRVDGLGNPMPCVSSPLSACDVRATVGTHQLEVGAPGFRTSRLTVDARGTTPECGCATFDPQRVDVVLVPE